MCIRLRRPFTTLWGDVDGDVFGVLGESNHEPGVLGALGGPGVLGSESSACCVPRERSLARLFACFLSGVIDPDATLGLLVGDLGDDGDLLPVTGPERAGGDLGREVPGRYGGDPLRCGRNSCGEGLVCFTSCVPPGEFG